MSAPLKKASTHWAVHAFMLSLGCNLFLLGVICFLAVREGNARKLIPFRSPAETVAVSIPKRFQKELNLANFNELIEKLRESDVAKRDAVLTHLIAVYGIDCQKCLGYVPPLKPSQKGASLCYHLEAHECEKIAQFLQKERFPFILSQLIELFRKNPQDKELRQFLLAKPAFIVLKTLAARQAPHAKEPFLLKLVMEAGGRPLELLYQEVTDEASFSKEMWERVLVRFLEKGSKTAAYLLVLQGKECTNQLEEVLKAKMIDLMDEKTQEALSFVQSLLESPSISPDLRERALSRYTQFTQSHSTGS